MWSHEAKLIHYSKLSATKTIIGEKPGGSKDASCMKEDARKAFFKTEERTEDILEQAVLSWVKSHLLG